MILYDIDELNKINNDHIPNLRVINQMLFNLYSKNQITHYLEYSADDFDTIMPLLKKNSNLNIISLENEVFNNDFILDELQDQIDYLKSQQNISFLNKDDLINPNSSTLLNQVGLLYIGPYEPEEENMKLSKTLLKSIKEFTPVCFYPADEMLMADAEKTIDWLENRWIGLFKDRIFVFEKMRLDNQLDLLGYSIQPSCFKEDEIMNIRFLLENKNLQKIKINSQTPHYKTENLLNYDITNILLNNDKLKLTINRLKDVFGITGFSLNQIWAEFAFPDEMKNDIKNNEIKKIISSQDKNRNQKNNNFKIIIPLQKSKNKLGLSYKTKNGQIKNIPYPECSFIVLRDSFKYNFPNLIKTNKNQLFGFVVLLLETNLT